VYEAQKRRRPVKGVYRLEVGDEAPDFTLPATGRTAGKGQKACNVTLSEYRGKKNVVLAFYPAAWTPV
jgi:peroxiredoxin